MTQDPVPLANNVGAEIRAVLFDFDGVLVDSEYLHYQCWSEALRPYGAAISWESYERRLTGISDPEAAPILLSLADDNPGDEAVSHALETKTNLYRKRCSVELAIPAQVGSWITKTSPNLLLAVVSSSSVEEVEPLLDTAGIRSSIAVLVCAEHVSRPKPDPESYLVALQRLRNHDPGLQPRHCLVYEDSEPGAAAALAAGMAINPVTSPADLLQHLKNPH